MQISSKTDAGKKRTENQDAFYASHLDDGTVLAVVCDGMGGANAGNIASAAAVEAIRRYVETAYLPTLSDDAKAQLLQNAIASANIEIFSMAYEDETLKGMGTTVVAVLAYGEKAIICHVGDSRAYIANGDLKQLTRDHSVVQSLIESGKITPEQANNHPEKNIITRALGVEENVLVDCMLIPFSKNNSILLCSDGLTNFTSEEYIKHVFESDDVSNKAELLCDEANRNGGGDNITVVVIFNSQKGM